MPDQSDPNLRATLRPVRRRSAQSKGAFRCIAATSEEIALPSTKRLGYLKQARLIQAAQAGDLDARNEVWLRHVRLAYTVVGRMHLPSRALADSLQEAQFGIARALQKFDVERLNEFSTYAYHWVLQHVRKLRVNTAFFGRIPDYQFASYLRFRRSVHEAPTPAEWFDARDAHLERDPSQYEQLLRIHICVSPESFDRNTLVPAIEAEPSAPLLDAQLRADIWDALEALEPRERMIICRRYGLPHGNPMTLKQIGDQLGLSRERVRQLQLSAESALRAALEDRGYDDEPGTRAAEDPENQHSEAATAATAACCNV